METIDNDNDELNGNKVIRGKVDENDDGINDLQDEKRKIRIELIIFIKVKSKINVIFNSL